MSRWRSRTPSDRQWSSRSSPLQPSVLAQRHELFVATGRNDLNDLVDRTTIHVDEAHLGVEVDARRLAQADLDGALRHLGLHAEHFSAGWQFEDLRLHLADRGPSAVRTTHVVIGDGEVLDPDAVAVEPCPDHPASPVPAGTGGGSSDRAGKEIGPTVAGPDAACIDRSVPLSDE